MPAGLFVDEPGVASPNKHVEEAKNLAREGARNVTGERKHMINAPRQKHIKRLDANSGWLSHKGKLLVVLCSLSVLMFPLTFVMCSSSHFVM